MRTRVRYIVAAVMGAIALFCVWQHLQRVALLEREASLSAEILMAFENSNTGMLSVKKGSTTIKQSNRAAREIFGYEPGRMAGTEIDDILPTPFRTQHAAQMKVVQDAVEKGTIGYHVSTMRCYGIKKDGSKVDVFVRVFVTKSGTVALVTLASEMTYHIMGANTPEELKPPIYP